MVQQVPYKELKALGNAPVGIKSQEDAGLHFLLAGPEKAICDMLMQEKHVPDQSISRLEVFFEDDMRMDLVR